MRGNGGESVSLMAIWCLLHATLNLLAQHVLCCSPFSLNSKYCNICGVWCSVDEARELDLEFKVGNILVQFGFIFYIWGFWCFNLCALEIRNQEIQISCPLSSLYWLTGSVLPWKKSSCCFANASVVFACTPSSVTIGKLLFHSMSWLNPNEVVTSKPLQAGWPSYLYWGAFYFYDAPWFLGSFHPVELMKKWRGVAESTSTIYDLLISPEGRRAESSSMRPTTQTRPVSACPRTLICARQAELSGWTDVSGRGETVRAHQIALCLSLHLLVSCCLTKYSPWLTSCSRPTSPNNPHPQVSSSIQKEKKSQLAASCLELMWL